MKNHSLFVTQADNAPATRGVAVSSTDTYYSKKISGSLYLSFSLDWTGTPTGAFTVQGSNKAEPDEATDDDWYTITADTDPTDPAGSASSTAGVVKEHNSKWKRIKYVNASGSGILSGDASVGQQ